MTVAINIWPAADIPQIALRNIVPQYLYQQYADDDNLQTFVAGYNAYAQTYLKWFFQSKLSIYAGNTYVAGPILDWVAGGLYGMTRPVLASGQQAALGPYATYAYGGLAYAALKFVGATTVYGTTDDIFKRIMTWQLYKGDGKQFTIKWLKRRIMRFLYGTDGTDYIIDNTYPVSVAIASGVVTITLTGTPPYQSTIFQAAVAQGALELPPFYTYTVNI